MSKNLKTIRAIVTDIEGTTSALSFVHDVLFPYARERLPAFVRKHASDPDVSPLLEAVQAGADVESVIETLIAWVDEDRKATPLKALQGMIWKQGFEHGSFKGHIYPDAAEALQRWHREGLRLFVYSSGSVQAQKLLFGYSEAGDLTALFDGYFDTTIGPKRATESYSAIAKTLAEPPEHVLFLSDVREELDAAAAAGMKTVWLQRDADSSDCPAPATSLFDTGPAESAHPIVKSFSEIQLSA